MKVQAIIPAAGTGTRLNAKNNKPLVLLQRKPLFVHALSVFEKCSLIDSVIIVANQGNVARFERISKRYHLRKVKKVVPGGKRRCDSVGEGLKALDEDTDTVVIHDGVRPLVSGKIIAEAIRLCLKSAAVTVAVPLKPTIKKVDLPTMTVDATLARDTLWEVQTPQVFKKELILRAHREFKGGDPTDDAAMVEALGQKVKVLKGDYRNIKITTPEDLVLAEALLK